LIPCSTHQIRRSTGLAVFQAAFVPPSGFGYPPDGLLPSNPSGSPSLPQRSWDSPLPSPALQSSAAFSQRRPHMLFHLHLMARSKLQATAALASASGTATSQYAPSACTHITGMRGRRATCLGFPSLGSTASQTFDPPSRIILPRAQKSRAFTRNTTHLGVSIGLRLAGLAPPAKGDTWPATLLRFLHQSGPQH